MELAFKVCVYTLNFIFTVFHLSHLFGHRFVNKWILRKI